MSELLPSELARLILGYFESKGYSRTVETMLNELPELVEVMQRRKKGQKVNLKVRDFFLTDLLDDYFTAKDIIYESITDYPTTFSSVKKIQALSDQVRNVVEIALRSRTYKFYPKNLYRSKQYIQSQIAEENALMPSGEIAITVGDFQNRDNSNERMNTDATPESSLPGSSSRVSNLDSEERSDKADRSHSTENNSEVIVPDTLTPQKRKGSLRKKGQPSPKLPPKTTKQMEADERMEKLIRNLIENKELHTKIADSINNTLFSSNDAENNNERDLTINNNNNNNDGGTHNNSSRQITQEQLNVSMIHPQHLNNKNNYEYNGETSSEVRNFSLSDNIISNLSHQVTNDPMMDSILALLDSDKHSSSHRQLSTPVPELPPSHPNLSFSNSNSAYCLSACETETQTCFNQSPSISDNRSTIRTPVPQQMVKSCSSEILEESTFNSSQSKTSQNMNIGSSASSVVFGEHVKNHETSKTLTLVEYFRNPNVNVDLDKSQNITLRECFQQSNKNESVQQGLETCNKDTQTFQNSEPSYPQNEQHTNTQLVLPQGLNGKSQIGCADVDSNKNNSNLKELPLRQEVLTSEERGSAILNGEIVKLICATENKLTTHSVKKDCPSKPFDDVKGLNNSTEENVRDESESVASSSVQHCETTNLPLELPQTVSVTLENIQSDDTAGLDSKLPQDEPVSHNRIQSCETTNLSSELPQTESEALSSVQPCETSNIDSELPQKYNIPSHLKYNMTSVASPIRPSSVQAIPVSMSNDGFVNSEYLSGTPDHPNSYTITELTPLPPSTPSEEWTSNNNRDNSSIVTNIDVLEPLPSTSSNTENKLSNMQFCTDSVVKEMNLEPEISSSTCNSDISQDGPSSKNCDKQEGNLQVNSKSNQSCPRTNSRMNKEHKSRKGLHIRRSSGKLKKSSRKLNKLGSRKKILNKRILQLSTCNSKSNSSLNINDCSEDIANSTDSCWEGTAEQLSQISNISHVENLVDTLESGPAVEKLGNNQNIDLVSENFEDLNKTTITENPNHVKDLSPELQSLVAFSKTFVLNNSYSRKEGTPAINEKITVYKGSLSTPRNKYTHIRVLDFNTPMKVSDSKKESTKAKANLQFSLSPKKKPLLTTGASRRVRTQSLTFTDQKKAPLESILESSLEGVNLSLTEKELSEEIDCNSYSVTKNLGDYQSLSDGESTRYCESELKTSDTSTMKHKKLVATLQTPGKETTLLCLEPTTPFPIQVSTVNTVTATLNAPGTDLNTPIPPNIASASTATPCLLSCIEEEISQDSYYQPSEKSFAGSVDEDNIEDVLVKTAQLSEIEMEKLKPGKNQLSPTSIQDVINVEKLNSQESQIIAPDLQNNNCVQETNQTDSGNDSLFNNILKNRPKYKLRKMTNKELGEVVEQEMNLFHQMRNLLQEHNKKSNPEESCSLEKTSIELQYEKKEQLKNNRLCKEKGRSLSKSRNSVYSRKKLPRASQKSESVSLTYEDFGNDIELLKECTVECLQGSYIESARTLLNSLLELFEKEKIYQSNFQEDQKVEQMVKMINYYSTPRMLQALKQKIRNYKPAQKIGECKNYDACDEFENNNMPTKQIERSDESDKLSDISINVLECEIDVIVGERSKSSEHVEPKSTGDLQNQENGYVDCVVDTLVDKPGSDSVLTTPILENNLSSRKTTKRHTIRLEDSSVKSKNDFLTPTNEIFISESTSKQLCTQTENDFVLSEKEDTAKESETYVGDVNKSPEESQPPNKPSRKEKPFEKDDDDDEYCLIERQLAELDGSVINSPSIRAELTSNTMNDDNISVMFTPSNHSSFSTSKIVSEIQPFFSPNKMLSYTPLPGTPVKQVEEVCQTVVKNKVALVAIPSQSIEKCYSSHNVMDDLEVTEDSTVANNSCSENVHTLENELYLSDDNSETDNTCSLSFSDYLDIFSLNLSPPNSKTRNQCDQINLVNKKNHYGIYENKEKELEQTVHTKSNKEDSNSKSTKFNEGNSNLKLSTKSSKEGESKRKSSTKSNKGDSNLMSSESNKGDSKRKSFTKSKEADNQKFSNEVKGKVSNTKSKKVIKEPENFSLDTSSTFKPKASESQPLSARKLSFVNSKRKRDEVEDTNAKIPKLDKFIDNIQSYKKGSRKKLSSIKSVPDNNHDVVSETQPAESIPEDIHRNSKNEACSNNDALDDTESLEELHLSSSDSENDQDSSVPTSSTSAKKSPNPEKISNCLLEGASFELSTTPGKLQAVISKFPNQDNFSHYNEESYFSIPPTPGKNLFPPEPSSTNNDNNGISTNRVPSYELRKFSSDKNAKVNDKSLTSEKKKSPAKVIKPRKQRVTPKKKSNQPKRTKKTSTRAEDNSAPSTSTNTKDTHARLKNLFGESTSDEKSPALKKQKSPGKKITTKKRKGFDNDEHSDSLPANNIKKYESATLSKNEKKNLQFLLNVINAKK